MLKTLTSLAILFLCLPVLDIGAMAATWTVYPTTEDFTTGTTTYDVKTDGEALVYGGASTGTTRMETAFFKFDISSIPDGTTVTGLVFNFYVNNTNWPYWSVTPVDLDPVPIDSTAALLWDDAQAEIIAGYYNYLNESSTYDVGWKTLALGGTANADLTAALAQDWFTIGAASRDTTTTYYLEIDGHTGANVPYLVVTDTPPPANDTCAGAIVIPGTPGSSSYTGDITLATNDYDCTAACVGGLDHAGKDVTYIITLPGHCEVCVTLNQSVMTWNGGVYMVTDCADVNGTCVAGASGWLAGGEDEVFCYSQTSTQTYYIIVDSRTDGGVGTFELGVDISCLATGPIDCDYTVTPLSGTVPFSMTHRITLSNLNSGGPDWFRCVAGRIAVTLANGNVYDPWRANFTDIQPQSNFTIQFPANLPATGTVIGSNTFVLTAEDVTPAPYNQPPYPASGTTCTSANVVVGVAP